MNEAAPAARNNARRLSGAGIDEIDERDMVRLPEKGCRDMASAPRRWRFAGVTSDIFERYYL
ncbi:MAG: hypothetical protein C3F11_13455 [Methylocystaceae bacterium]|nr:MAG: hypothetical protein C3F11_13455 [Methylocystaceae bacterium]